VKSLYKNQAGVAHLVLVSLVVIVIGVLGLAGWVVIRANNDDGRSAASRAASKQLVAECLKKIDDKDLCKYFGNWDGSKKFTVRLTDYTDNVTTASTMQVDGENTFTKTEGEPVVEVITIGDTTYTKGGNFWWKQTAKSSTGSMFKVSLDQYKFEEPGTDTTDKSRYQYKKIGKEACGTYTCFKYQFIDTSNRASKQYVWFDDDSYLMRKTREEGPESDGSFAEQQFSYGKVSVKAPSSVKVLAADQYILPGASEPTTMPNYINGTN